MVCFCTARELKFFMPTANAKLVTFYSAKKLDWNAENHKVVLPCYGAARRLWNSYFT